MPSEYSHHCIFRFFKDVYIIFTLAQVKQSASRTFCLSPCVAGMCWKIAVY